MNVYPTNSGRSITEIAAWGDKLANEALESGRKFGRDMDEAAASAVISVAVTQVVGPCSEGNAYTASLFLTGDFMRGRGGSGADRAQWSIDHFHQDDASRAAHSARLRAIADVVAASSIQLPHLQRCVRELRAYADIYDPAVVT